MREKLRVETAHQEGNGRDLDLIRGVALPARQQAEVDGYKGGAELDLL